MIEPGVYQQSFGGVTFRELWRFGGPVGFLFGLMMKLTGKRGNYAWLPVAEAEVRCPRAELSQDALAQLQPQIEHLAALDYTVVWYFRVARNLDANLRDGGGLFALHRDGKRIVCVMYIHHVATVGDQVRQTEAVRPFGILIREDAPALVVVNHRNYFDDPAWSEVVELPPAAGLDDVAERLETDLERTQAPVRAFSDPQELAALLDERSEGVFSDRIRRGLFVRVPDDEADAILEHFGLTASETPA